METTKLMLSVMYVKLLLGPKKVVHHFRLIIKRNCEYLVDYLRFKRMSINGRFRVKWRDRYPCLSDKTTETVFDRHYVFHTAWAARILSKTLPACHYDVSSYIYFSTLVSAFVPTVFIDYRPAHLELEGLKTQSGNLQNLAFANNSIMSISCMHVVEHIGLGRYGDELDPDGDIKAISELKRVLAPGGDLLFVVPIGTPRIMFNAHRIYSYAQIMEYFEDLRLVEFALIPDNAAMGDLVLNASEDLMNAQRYGCGCFWFRK